tara:strand:+ start:225 stop:407 length:183 start_codon:yes stop_codon:yes gene_type:complete
MDGGLMILSRFPIVATSVQPYAYSEEKDGLARRGVLYGKIKIKDDKHLHIFTTHMCSTHY